jgi:hypothetical protein
MRCRLAAPQEPPDHGRQRAGRQCSHWRRCADHGADHDQHADQRCGRRSTRSAAARMRGRPHPRLLPRRGEHAALPQIVRAARMCRSSPTSISTTSARSRRRMRARRACASTPATSARRARARSGQGRQGQWLRDPHRRQCRQPREGPAGKIRRALPRGAGRKRARSYQAAAGPRFPRIQGGGEGVGRVPRGRRLPAAGRRGRLPAASRHHRGGRADRRHGEVGDRHRQPALGRDRRHDPRLACRPNRKRKCASASRS